MAKTKERSGGGFLVQGSLLAAAGILVRIIGLAYRIPMQNKIGSEGMGIYSSAYYVYNIMLLLSSYSMPLAVSKLVSARLAKGQHKNAFRIFKSALVFSLISGGLASLITYFGAGFFANILLNEPGVTYALRVLAPTIFVMAFLGALRGFFQGHGTMIPTAVSQILEQIVNAAVSIIAAYMLFDLGASIDLAEGTEGLAAAYGAAGGTLGTAMGALTALIFCALVLLAYRRTLQRKIARDRTKAVESYRDITRLLIITIVPVIISGTVYNISNLIDNSIYGYYMSFIGSSAIYMTNWGVYSGQYYLLINVPIAISNSLASSMLPSLTASVTSGNNDEVLKKIGMTIRFSMIIAIPSAIGLTVLGGPIVRMLFNADTELGGSMLLCGSLAVVFFSLSTIGNGILQGLNRMSVPVKNAAVSLAVHVAALFVLLYGFRTGIYGIVFANMIFGLMMCILNGFSIAKYSGYTQEVKKTFLLPGLAALIMGAVTYGFYRLMLMISSSNTLSCLLAIIVAVAVYFVLLIVLKGVEEDELYDMPMGGRIVRIARRLRLM